MTTGGSPDDGTISGIPWAAAFDPAVNIRALGEIQARGFRAASDVVDRFVRLGKRTPPNDEVTVTPSETKQSEPGDGPAFPDVDQVLGAWQKVVGQVAGSLRGVVTPQSDVATFDLMNSSASGHVGLETSEPGAVSSVVWLHNGGPEDLGKVRLRCSDLLAHDGALIPAEMVRFEPDIVPMVARSSRGVTIEVDVPDDTGAGCYRGTLLADGHPDVWLPVVLNVVTSLFMTSTADRAELISVVEDRLRQVGKVVRRSMLDAMPDGEPVQWLYGADARVPVAARQGAAARTVHLRRAGVRRRTRRPAGYRCRNRVAAQRVSGPRRHRRRQRDAPGTADAVGGSTGLRRR